MNRTLRLLLSGAKMTGSFTEGLNYIYEELYVSEDIMHLQSFCNWLDTEIGGAGPLTIEDLYFAFGNQDIPFCQELIKSTKERLALYKC